MTGPRAGGNGGNVIFDGKWIEFMSWQGYYLDEWWIGTYKRSSTYNNIYFGVRDTGKLFRINFS